MQLKAPSAVENETQIFHPVAVLDTYLLDGKLGFLWWSFYLRLCKSHGLSLLENHPKTQRPYLAH